MPSPTDHGPDFTERRNHKRRQKFTPLRHPERRSGFDRRAHARGFFGHPLEQLRDSPAALAGILIAVNVLNVLDLVLTFQLLHDHIVEGNLIMRSLIGTDPLVALIVKVVIVAGVTLAIWAQRRFRLMLFLGLTVFSVFVVLTAYEAGLVLIN